MLYRVIANGTLKRGHWTTGVDVPTFFLDSDCQGIVNAEHAVEIATRMLKAINPAVVFSVSVGGEQGQYATLTR